MALTVIGAAVPNGSKVSRTFLPFEPESTVVWSNVNLGPYDDTALCKMYGWYLELIKSCQAEIFEDEIRRIRKGKQLIST